MVGERERERERERENELTSLWGRRGPFIGPPRNLTVIANSPRKIRPSGEGYPPPLQRGTHKSPSKNFKGWIIIIIRPLPSRIIRPRRNNNTKMTITFAS
jgi:hypothetical protein